MVSKQLLFSSLISLQLLVYLLPSDGNRYPLSPQYRKTANFTFYTQIQKKYKQIHSDKL